jgi:hypothetical protein
LDITNCHITKNKKNGIDYFNKSEGILKNNYIGSNANNGIYVKDSKTQIEDTISENNYIHGFLFVNSDAILRKTKAIGNIDGNGVIAMNSKLNIVESLFSKNNNNGIA